MKVGDVVTPIDENRPLFCGTQLYPHAVVCLTSPLVLISEDGEMRWNKRQHFELKVLGQASHEVLERCMARLRRDHRIMMGR
jgi:hypothetical protein